MIVLFSWQENFGKHQRTSLECTTQVNKASAGLDLSLSLLDVEKSLKDLFCLIVSEWDSFAYDNERCPRSPIPIMASKQWQSTYDSTQ
jgi:hypothetical protein